jgi:hypothetical protein
VKIPAGFSTSKELEVHYWGGMKNTYVASALIFIMELLKPLSFPEQSGYLMNLLFCF